MPSSNLAKAKLVPMDGDNPVEDERQHITVQFNPASLRVTLSNTLDADRAGGGGGGPAAQFIDKSESTLAIELLFDTSVGEPEQVEPGEGGGQSLHQDVRELTRRIAVAFMQPRQSSEQRLQAPLRCQFQWGSFLFTGMLATYSETLDFFASSGIPLRAKLALTFKEDRFQFEIRDLRGQGQDQTSPAMGGPGVSAAEATRQGGRDPRQWRETSMYNGEENARATDPNGVAVPSGAHGNAQPGGLGVRLGTSVPGAFPARLGR